jgi:hypothetical protein
VLDALKIVRPETVIRWHRAGFRFQFVEDGTAAATIVNDGVRQIVEAGGKAETTKINTGGLEKVLAGGEADSVIFGGPSATLDLANANCVQGPITGFQHGDNIDLRNLNFGAGTTLAFSENAQHTGGTLTISDGSSVGQLTLLGQYSAGQFQLSSDGHGGTLVSDGGQFIFNPAVFAAAAQRMNPAVYAAAPH